MKIIITENQFKKVKELMSTIKESESVGRDKSLRYRKVGRKFKYSDDDLRKIAKQYDSRVEWKRNDSGSYSTAYNRGKEFFDDVTSDMKKLNWREKYIYAYEFYDKNENPVAAYVGLSCDMSRRSKEHETGYCPWGGDKKTVVFKFIKNNPHLTYKVIMLEPKPLKDKVAQDKEEEWEKKYRENGWETLNIAKTGSLGGILQYSDDDLRKIAKKYETYAEWNRNDPSTNLQARRRGKEFYDDITSHIQSLHKSYSNDDFREIALKYKTKVDWKDNDNNSYVMSQQRGKEFYDDITSHMIPFYKSYSDDDLRKIALKYETKKEWNRNDPSTNLQARRRGKEFYKDITSHMVALHKSYSNDDFREIALKYNTKVDWKDNDNNSYAMSQQRGKEFYDDITSHMIPSKRFHSDDDLRKIALKYETKKEWNRDDPNSNQQARKRGKEFYKDITSHMLMMKNTYSNDDLRKIALKYNTKSEWTERDNLTYRSAYKRGKEFWDSITSHMTSLYNSRSNDDLRKIAKKYETYAEWNRDDPNSNQQARKRGKEFYKDITSHMS